MGRWIIYLMQSRICYDYSIQNFQNTFSIQKQYYNNKFNDKCAVHQPCPAFILKNCQSSLCPAGASAYINFVISSIFSATVLVSLQSRKLTAKGPLWQNICHSACWLYCNTNPIILSKVNPLLSLCSGSYHSACINLFSPRENNMLY